MSANCIFFYVHIEYSYAGKNWIYFLLFMIYMVIITLNYDKIVHGLGGKHDRVYKEYAEIHRA